MTDEDKKLLIKATEIIQKAVTDIENLDMHFGFSGKLNYKSGSMSVSHVYQVFGGPIHKNEPIQVSEFHLFAEAKGIDIFK